MDARGRLEQWEQSGFRADWFGLRCLLWWGDYEDYARMLAASDAKGTEKAKEASKMSGLAMRSAVDQVRGDKAEQYPFA